MTDWLQDCRYALRMLRKRPGASALAILALALGIGLTTTMFSIVEGVVLRDLPYDQSHRLVAVLRGSLQDPNSRQSVTQDDLIDWRTRQASLESLAGYADAVAIVAGENGWPEEVSAVRVTPDLFRVLRVAPIRGRTFTDADASKGAPSVVVVSERLWRAKLGANPDAVGSTLQLNGARFAIVGIMPAWFAFPASADLWMPLGIERSAVRGRGDMISVVGRLRDEAAIERAAAEFTAIARQLAEAYPENRDVTARVRPFHSEVVPSRISLAFYTMLAAVFGVMLIACVNVTNMQLARAAERSGEYAIRSALGSGGWRLVRQALAEGLILSICGALLGLAIAHGGAAAMMAALAEVQSPSWIDIRVNPTVLAFVLVLTIGATIVSSLAPGLRIARIDANDVLKSQTRTGSGVHVGRFGRGLIVVEVAVSCALLVVSGLMIRSIVETSRLDYPFATRDVLVARMGLDSRAYPTAGAVVQASDALETRLSAVPGVRRVAVATNPPGAQSTTTFEVEGGATNGRRASASRHAVGRDYFDVLDVTIREGRVFTASDGAGAPPVALVDELFAESHLAPGPAIGRRIRFDGGATEPWLTVIGVVPTLAPRAESGRVVGTVYVPFAQRPSPGFTILTRTAGEPLTFAPNVRRAAAELFPTTPLRNVNSLDGEYWRRGWTSRLFGGLFLFFGASALLLAGVGLYGVMASTVRRRTSELGIRMALGASRGAVVRLVLWQALWRVAAGVAVGLWPGWLIATLLRDLITGVSLTDPVVYGSAIGVLFLAGTLATLAPALRAALVSPMTALRSDG